MPTTQIGTIKTVNTEKGFGFIKRDDESDVFFHMSGLDASLAFDDVMVGLRVEFEVMQTDKGSKALKIRKVK